MSYRKTAAAWAGGVAVALAAASAAHANQVVNGGFETGDFSGWSTVIGPFSGVDAVAAHSGSFGAFTGEFDTVGTISQDIATVAGTSYSVEFWLRSDGETPNRFFVSWDGVALMDATDLAAFPYTHYVLNAVAAGATTTLQFGFRNDNGFTEFDDISVTAVPEPSSYVLFGLGLLTLGWMRRHAG